MADFEAVADRVSSMDGGEVAFLAFGGLAVLLLLKTCFSMCAAIINPPPDTEVVQPAGAPSAKLLSDAEAGRAPPTEKKKPKSMAAKLSPKLSRPGSTKKHSVEPLHMQPLTKNEGCGSP